MPSWLNQHRKADLVALFQEAGLENPDDLTKIELVLALDKELIRNPIHQRNPSFIEYYNRRSTGAASSPIKREPTAAAFATINSNGETDSTSRARGRRTYYLANGEIEFESSEPLSSPVPPIIRRATARTPARPRTSFPHVSSELIPTPYQHLPPSPAVIADVVEEQTARLEAGLGNFWKSTKIADVLLLVRGELSSLYGIHMAILMLEGFFLQRDILPWKYAFDIPAFSLVGKSSIPVFFPDLFVLLTSYWWSTSILWATMNLWLPLIAGWFCNLTLKSKEKDGVASWQPRYQIDPLTFSVTKAVLTWLVFQQGMRLGVFANETVDRVVLAMPVGYSGVMISAYIGIVTSIWDGLHGWKGWK